MTEDAAEVTAHDDTSSQEQVDSTATPETEKLELSPDEQAEAEAKAEEEQKQASDRTKTRRRQRRDAKVRRATEAQHKAEIDAAYWKGKAESGGSKQEAEGETEPQQDDFESYDEYNRAIVRWEIAKAVKGTEKPSKEDKAPESQTSQDIAGEPTEEFKTFKAAGTEKYGQDFDDMIEAAMNNEFASSTIMVETMMEDENGADMAMHFYDNPEEAARIAQLSPRKQVQELTKLGETLGKSSSESPARKISGAPEPITTEKGSSAHSVDLDKVDMEDYVKQRRKQKMG